MRPQKSPPVRFGFLIVPLFPMYVLVLAMDALRLANKYAGQRKFDWLLVSDRGRAIEASNGITMDCDIAVSDARELDYLFVLAGDDQSRSLTPGIRQALHRLSRSKTVLGAIDSGVFLLAACRILDRRPITVHPGAVSAFQEQFPTVEVIVDSVSRAGSLLTCAGGIAVVDLMLGLIREHCGPMVAHSVANDMVITARSAVPSSSQAVNQQGAAGIHDVVELMEKSLETPLSLQALSRSVRRSSRQITRQFRQASGRSPMEYYRTLRLNHAKQLLFQSDLSVSEIAMAAGFQSLSAFSRSFSSAFGGSPRQLKSRLRNEGNAAAVPAAHRAKRIPVRRKSPSGSID